ncbi:hypothetical protein [Nonlabens agnitus]|uniref:Uncharacterized protein n=1 Tax=Nonlabens agnitus TaxID=870484 RepID=A0A2S9WXN0_9FLAO|nr:hypothetical protein [Nonlabens agnitus]PRP68136.1 hypothetical protein BST86_14075 [Nonlabens agnitus]
MSKPTTTLHGVKKTGELKYLDIYNRYEAARKLGYQGKSFLKMIIVPEYEIELKSAEIYVVRGRKIHKENLKKEKKEKKAA